MATLTGKQFKALSEALLSAFNRGELRRLVREELDERLEDLVAPGNLQDTVFELVGWAERRNEVETLMRGAVAANPGNRVLKRFVAAYEASIQRGISHQRLEKIVDHNQTFKTARRWRDKLERIERQVCRIERAGHAAGTGFLVAPQVVLTNHHVVAQEIGGSPATSLAVRFDYHLRAEVDVPDEGRACGLAADWLIDSSPHDPVDEEPPPKAYEPGTDALDYAFLRLADPVGEEVAADEARGFVALPEDPPPLTVGGPVFIVQHQGGQVMSLAMKTDSIVEINDARTRVRHRTNTLGGSSGSPCFDSDWNLIALHHSGDPTKIKPEYNEGIPIQTIRTAVAAPVRAAVGW